MSPVSSTPLPHEDSTSLLAKRAFVFHRRPTERYSPLRRARSTCLNDRITSLTTRAAQAMSPSIPSPQSSYDGKTDQYQSQTKNVRICNDEPQPGTREQSTELQSLCEVIKAAEMREILHVSSKTLDSSFRSRLRRHKRPTSTRWSQPSIVANVPEETTPLRSRNNSFTPSLSPQPMLVILSQDGYLLQYDTHGVPTRLPEKVLRLRQSTIAIASDAIAGEHWVLNIVCDPQQPEIRRKFSLRDLRFRLDPQHTEDDRNIQELLLVFRDSMTLNKWLIAVRKAIEALGGLQYSPDSRSFDAELQTSRLMKPSDGDKESVHFPSAPFVFPLAESEDQLGETLGTPTLPSPLTTCSPVPSFYPVSATDPSLDSLTELDRLRDSLILGSPSPPGTRSSSTGSIPLSMASVDSVPKFDHSSPSIDFTVHAPGGAGRHKKPPPAAIVTGAAGRKRPGTGSPISPSPHPPRTPTLPTEQLDSLAGRFAPKAYSEIYSPVEATKMADWLNSLTKAKEEQWNDVVTSSESLFSSDDASSPGPGYLGSSRTSDVDPSTVADDLSRMLDTDVLATSSEAAPPPYSLTPMRSSSLDTGLRPSLGYPRTSPSIDRPVTSTGIGGKSVPLRSPSMMLQNRFTKEPQQAPPSSTTRRKAPSVVTRHNHLVVDQPHEPQRPPAVNDSHIATCFGAEMPFARQSIQIGGEQMDFPLAAKTADFPISPSMQQALELPLRPSRPTVPQLCRKSSVSCQKSLPAIRYCSGLPLSPPPSAPLPAVPTQSDRRVSDFALQPKM